MNYSKHIIIYGDSSNIAIKNEVYLVDSSDLGNRILEGLKTFLDEAVEKCLMEKLNYSIFESGTDFVYNSVVGKTTMFIYKRPHNNIIGYWVDALFNTAKAADKMQYCIKRLVQDD